MKKPIFVAFIAWAFAVPAIFLYLDYSRLPRAPQPTDLSVHNGDVKEPGGVRCVRPFKTTAEAIAFANSAHLEWAQIMYWPPEYILVWPKPAKGPCQGDSNDPGRIPDRTRPTN